jgi:hypothetical protein
VRNGRCGGRCEGCDIGDVGVLMLAFLLLSFSLAFAALSALAIIRPISLLLGALLLLVREAIVLAEKLYLFTVIAVKPRYRFHSSSVDWNIDFTVIALD